MDLESISGISDWPGNFYPSKTSLVKISAKSEKRIFECENTKNGLKLFFTFKCCYKKWQKTTKSGVITKSGVTTYPIYEVKSI